MLLNGCYGGDTAEGLLRRGKSTCGTAGDAGLAICERDHRDGTNIRLLRQEIAQEFTELALAQGDHCFFHLDGIALLLRGGDQLLLERNHLLFLIDHPWETKLRGGARTK